MAGFMIDPNFNPMTRPPKPKPGKGKKRKPLPIPNNPVGGKRKKQPIPNNPVGGTRDRVLLNSSKMSSPSSSAGTGVKVVRKTAKSAPMQRQRPLKRPINPGTAGRPTRRGM